MTIPAEFNDHAFNESRFNSNMLTMVLSGDSITTSDALVKQFSKMLAESQFLQENELQKQLSKGFLEEVRISIWIEGKRKPAQEAWGDQ